MLAQIKAMKEAENMTEKEAREAKERQELARIEADRKLKQQSKLAHDLAQELTKPKANHNSSSGEPAAADGYSSTAVARQLAKPSMSRQLSRTNLYKTDETDKTAAALAAKKASLKAPRRTLQDKEPVKKAAGTSLKRKGSKHGHKTSTGGQSAKSRTSVSSDEHKEEGEAPRGRASVTGISDDEDFADDEVIPAPPRRVNSADGKRRHSRPVFNAADVMKNLTLNATAAKASIDSEDIVFD